MGLDVHERTVAWIAGPLLCAVAHSAGLRNDFETCSTPVHVSAPAPASLTEAVRHHRQHVPVPAHADMAAGDFDVTYQPGPFVVATGLPCDNTIRPAVDGSGAHWRRCAQPPPQGRIDCWRTAAKQAEEPTHVGVVSLCVERRTHPHSVFHRTDADIIAPHAVGEVHVPALGADDYATG